MFSSSSRRLIRVCGVHSSRSPSFMRTEQLITSRGWRSISSKNANDAAVVEPKEEEEEEQQQQKHQQKQQETNNDHFALLGVSRRFHLDRQQLQSSYRKLMTEYHPDKHSNKSIEEKEHVEDMASRITHAYQTLVTPHTRATHLLELVGRPLEEATNAEMVGPAFLMEVMEWRQAIDDIDVSSAGDGTGTGTDTGTDTDTDTGTGTGTGEQAMEELARLKEKTKEQMDQVLDHLDEAFAEDKLDKAVELAARLQYWNRISETIEEKV